MRRRLIPFVFICATCLPASMDCPSATADAAEQTFPYKACISADDVYVRSGPGRNYYPTDKLRAGQVVEVYRHDPGGWYAIRPPKGSFTWVSSRFIRSSRDGLAEVTGKEVAARVGSRFSDIRDVIQVRLHEGELVEPLPSSDMQSTTSGRSSKKWAKIAPPSGEFRWVHGKFVDTNYKNSGIRKAPAGNNPLIQQSSATRVHARESFGQSTLAERPARRQSPDGATHIKIAKSALTPAIDPEEFQNRIDDAEMELSVMVVEEPTVWQFDELIAEAQELLNCAETALQRGKARVLLSKIDRFTNIKDRHSALNTVWEDTQYGNQRLAELRRRHESKREQVAGRFDGKGRLTRVVSPKRGAPRYALVDESGDVQCYVTPAPGVNLRHYEQRLVGVTGSRGYVPEQRAHHIMAKHIDVLDAKPTKLR